MNNPINARTRQLHQLGQSLWVDNISRDMLATGTLARYVAELSVTGLTSNPTIFEQAIGQGGRYDDDIARLKREGLTSEATFFAQGFANNGSKDSGQRLAVRRIDAAQAR